MSEKILPIQLKRELRKILKNLRPLIPKGAIKKLSLELDMFTNIVYDVIGGRRCNLEIIEKLIKDWYINKCRFLGSLFCS